MRPPTSGKTNFRSGRQQNILWKRAGACQVLKKKSIVQCLWQPSPADRENEGLQRALGLKDCKCYKLPLRQNRNPFCLLLGSFPHNFVRLAIYLVVQQQTSEKVMTSKKVAEQVWNQLLESSCHWFEYCLFFLSSGIMWPQLYPGKCIYDNTSTHVSVSKTTVITPKRKVFMII